MMFTAIPGLDHVKHNLIHSAQSNHLAHALLLSGQSGALSLPLALAFATYLHCENKQADQACGVCSACRKSLKYIHPDTHFTFPMGNTKGKKTDEEYRADTLKLWREFLLTHPFGNLNRWINSNESEDKQIYIPVEEGQAIIRSLVLKPFESASRVIIIWLPEFMNFKTANTILKVLEEPPVNTFFLLITDHVERLLPTILSRTQIVQVPLLTDEDVARYLQKKYSLDELKLQEIVQLAEGDLGFAIYLITSDNQHYQAYYRDWMHICFKKDYAQLLSFAEEFHEMDKLVQQNLLLYSLRMMRETLLQISGAEAIRRVKGDEEFFIRNFSKNISLPKIEIANRLINEAAYHLERNGSAKMIFMDLSLQLAKTINP